MIDRSDPLWFKDAVIYQLHVKAFFDSNNDGIGDFPGLIQKLDYVADLGVNTIWLLPFYPSPLRDDGYDIADYRDINRSYGTMRDFRRFVEEAHRRSLRVVTELVINHTSDQHPWFQRARNAKPGSAARNFYVWSDTDQKYQGTRIIFLDTESSNWTWDPVAKAYFWHRFYSHQPDLNFDNPRVLKEVMGALHFWLKIGVDGLRLDAVPYLCEREGTNNENLRETHEILRKIRAEVDAHYPDRMLLAEANQWPEDTQEYFGAGDECHMAFHFPLMPRMYMAIAQEDRHPITDIMRQTPDIPDNCQWAVFLRNHDELTLEMVTDQERDYLWDFYAGDRRMRINLGIRRRLAPLLEHDRRKIELMKSLLLSMPGTPVLYYGDEIGMGDNIYLGDRDGVRTPMQWSPDRNGGFSRADPARLYLPPIMDPVYGFDAVNVESQQRDPSSLLNWTKRMLSVRQGHQAFGRGNLRFLYPGNRKILAYLRELDGETLLCVANMSRSAQAVELNLGEFRGRTPIELLGRTAFPPIGDLPYLLTLTAYGFYWFVLSDQAALPRWHTPTPEPLPEFTTLVLRGGWESLLAGREAVRLEREVLPAYLPKHRWFAAKNERLDSVWIESAARLEADGSDYMLPIARAALADGSEQRYQIPLAIAWSEDAVRPDAPLLPYTLAKVREFRTVGGLYEAVADDGFWHALVRAAQSGTSLPAGDGTVTFHATAAMAEEAIPADAGVRRLGTEQSNSSTIVGEQVIVKLYRRLVEGPHPELEMTRFLTEVAGFANTPALMGWVEHRDADDTPTALAVMQRLVYNQGDGWGYTLNYLDRLLEEQYLTDHDDLERPGRAEGDGIPPFASQAARLGQRTAELHRALAHATDDPAFVAEPIGEADVAAWREAVLAQAEVAFDALGRAVPALEGDAAERARRLLDHKAATLALIERLASGVPQSAKTRTHGDYHLGQVLVVESDFFVIDFEGEPAKSIAERRAKTSPLRDVAGMLRSFDYAAATAVRLVAERFSDDPAQILADALGWRDATGAAFLAAYREHAAGTAGLPESTADAERLLTLFQLEKALYEICYEAANRPTWLDIPVEGALRLIEQAIEDT